MALTLTTPVLAYDIDNPADFFRADQPKITRQIQSTKTPRVISSRKANINNHTGAVPQAIVQAANNAGLGQWSGTLVRIAKIESGFRCSPGGNGGGLFQFSTPSRWGLTRASAKSCGPNISAAMRYAKHCVAQGAKTSYHMMACWNSGSPRTSTRRLEKAYQIAMR